MKRIVGMALLVCLMVAWIAKPAEGETLSIVDASVLHKPETGLVYFSATFNRAPNLTPALSVLEDGDAASGDDIVETGGPLVFDLPNLEGFQFLLDVAPNEESGTAFPWEVVARGTEASTANGIPLRDAQAPPVEGDLNSGGWGPVLGVSPYTLDGATVSFSAPNSWVGVGEDGVRYELLAMEGGTLVDQFVPTPTAAVAGLFLLSGMATRRRPMG